MVTVVLAKAGGADKEDRELFEYDTEVKCWIET